MIILFILNIRFWVVLGNFSSFCGRFMSFSLFFVQSSVLPKGFFLYDTNFVSKRPQNDTNFVGNFPKRHYFRHHWEPHYPLKKNLYLHWIHQRRVSKDGNGLCFQDGHPGSHFKLLKMDLFTFFYHLGPKVSRKASKILNLLLYS